MKKLFYLQCIFNLTLGYLSTLPKENNNNNFYYFKLLLKLFLGFIFSLYLTPLGDIERLQRFWLTGTCKPKKQQRRASEPLAIEQFLSAYILLSLGIGLAILLLILEHTYFKYLRKRLAKTDSGGCCALVSLVSF